MLRGPAHRRGRQADRDRAHRQALQRARRGRPRPRRGRARRAAAGRRLLDYSKYKYEQEQRAKAARKHQQQINVREIKLRPKIATHDYETKKGHVERFLRQQDKVKVTIMFRGREQAYPERGRTLLRACTRTSRDRDHRAGAPAGGPQHEHAARARAAEGERGRRPALGGLTPTVCFNKPSDAEDEDTFGRQEALPQDGEGQAARPARLLEPHPREEVAEAQAPHVDAQPRSRRPDRKRVRTLLAGKGR